MRLGSLLFSRAWYLMIPVFLGLSWYRVDDLRTAHQHVWRLTQRYAGVRQEMKQIRSNAMSRVKTERR